MISSQRITNVVNFYENKMQTQKKNNTVVKAKEKAAEKKAFGKEQDAFIKKVTLEASTEEELVEKIQKVDWNKVRGESIGARFDLTI